MDSKGSSLSPSLSKYKRVEQRRNDKREEQVGTE